MIPPGILRDKKSTKAGKSRETKPFHDRKPLGQARTKGGNGKAKGFVRGKGTGTEGVEHVLEGVKRVGKGGVSPAPWTIALPPITDPVTPFVIVPDEAPPIPITDEDRGDYEAVPPDRIDDYLLEDPDCPTPVRVNKRRQITNPEIRHALMKHNGLLTYAARDLDVRYNWLWKRVDADESLKLCQLEARDRVVDMAEAGIARALKKKERWAIEKTLDCLGKERGWVPRRELGGVPGSRPVYVTIAPVDGADAEQPTVSRSPGTHRDPKDPFEEFRPTVSVGGADDPTIQ